MDNLLIDLIIIISLNCNNAFVLIYAIVSFINFLLGRKMPSVEKPALTDLEKIAVSIIDGMTHDGHQDEKARECAYREGLVAKLDHQTNESRAIPLESITRIVDEVCKGFPQHSRPQAPSEITVTPSTTHNIPSTRAR